MYKKFQQGFTLIEMIVSLALFSVVITISVGALLALIASNQQLQDEQSVMTNLSFAVDSMTREIRTGTSYYCVPTVLSVPVNVDSLSGENDCDSSSGGTGVAFVEAGNSITSGAGDRILYYFDENKIFRKIGNNAAQSVVSSGIYIEEAVFYVSDSAPLPDDEQPAVTIFIKARESNGGSKSYEIQTTITQRTLDI
jgi:prepilin-type N-terminal cleavage/methylation domain-containing protein